MSGTNNNTNANSNTETTDNIAQAKKYIGLTNLNDRRVVTNNQKLWSTIITLEQRHIDEFPFSAREVMREMGKGGSITIITRERGGLKQFLQDYRDAFITRLAALVQVEQTKTGEISDKFCRNLGFLISAYAPLFTIDIITDGHHNTKAMLNVVRPLILKERFVFFMAEFLICQHFFVQFFKELV